MGETKQLDDDQKAAVEAEGNLVVSAGAGSGKTTVLAERYLRLLSEKKAGVEDILTLTFTVKAAAEMYQRIYSKMASSADPAVRAQLENFGNARISTLDAFCVSIAKTGAQRYGISPSFAMDPAAVEKLAEDSALSFILSRRKEGALRSFLAANGFERTWRGFFVPVAVKLMTSSRPADFASMLRCQYSFLEKTITESYGRLEGYRARILALGESKSVAVSNYREAALPLPPFPRMDEGEGLAALKSYAQALKSVRRPNSNAKDLPCLEILGFVDELKETCAALVSALDTLPAMPETGDIFRILAEFQEEFARSKRAAAVMGFTDAAAVAVQLLIEDTSLRRHFKGKFRRIMIDEFQDDNELQKNLLYLLSEKADFEGEGVPPPSRLEGNKLFFVGDAKQSIFLFRGADVSVFNRLAAELDSRSALSLKKNYRSEPKLIDFFNALFKSVFGGAEKDYEARYEPLVARGAVPHVDPEIAWLEYPRREDEGEEFLEPRKAEAYALASFIKERVEGRSLLIADGSGSRPAGYGDFAVLLRSTSYQAEYERFLLLLDVPYTSLNVCSLFLEAPVNDIFSALSLAVYPGDRMAWASFLRSPFVRLSDEAFASVMISRGEAYDASCDAALPAQGADRERYEAGREVLDAIRGRADRVPIAAIVSMLWNDFGYRYAVLEKKETHSSLEFYDYLYALASRADAKSECLAAFLEGLRPMLGNGEKLEDAEVPKEAGEGVRIMTVHKAKGLEFPVVIIPNMENVGMRGERGGNPYCLSGKFGLTLNIKPPPVPGKKRGSVNFFYESGREEETKKGLAELKRLFYVACTRAESHLIFTSCEPKPPGENAKSLDPKSFRNLLENARAVMPAGMVAKKEIAPLSKASYLSLDRGGPGLPPDKAAQAYAAARRVERKAERRECAASELIGQEEEGGYEVFPLEPFDPLLGEDGVLSETDFGTLAHAVLENLIAGRAAPYRFAAELERALPEGEAREGLIAGAKDLAERFLGSALGKAALASGNARTEVSFVSSLDAEGGPVFVSGRIDLVFETDTELIVVDFKTDRSMTRGRYSGQVGLYRYAAGEIFESPGKAVKAFVFYLRAGRAVEDAAQIDLARIASEAVQLR